MLVKKLIGIVFISVLLLQMAVSYVYFIARLTTIRQEMRVELKNTPDDQLTLLTFSTKEYKKLNADEHEVEVNGKMYDIARTVMLEDKVMVYALHDEAEDNLLAFLQEIVKRSSKDKRPVPSQLIQLLTLQFVIVENKTSSPTGISVVHTTPYNSSFLSFLSSIESPPPRG